jgi:hypothetical protein
MNSTENYVPIKAISVKFNTPSFCGWIILITNIKNNMTSSLITMRAEICLRKRAIIEPVNDELKNSCQIEHFWDQHFTNFLSNIVAECIAWSFLLIKISLLRHQY